jgi:chorismate synthase
MRVRRLFIPRWRDGTVSHADYTYEEKYGSVITREVSRLPLGRRSAGGEKAAIGKEPANRGAQAEVLEYVKSIYDIEAVVDPATRGDRGKHVRCPDAEAVEK